MQYEKIILELMSRIQELESDVKELKGKIEVMQRAKRLNKSGSVTESLDYLSAETAQGVTYNKMTESMIQLCYQYAKQAYREKDADMGMYADEAAEKTGMNRSSAFINIYAAKHMLDGDVYKRAVSAKAIRIYLDSILRDFGKEHLEKAIVSTREHVAYRRQFGHPVKSIEVICDEYEEKL